MSQFYKCDLCKQIVSVVKEGAGTLTCCGQDMTELVAGTVDASREKHVPYVTVNGSEISVQIGTVQHPMESAHNIEWVCLKTNRGFQMKYLEVGKEPVARFYIEKDEKPVTVYAYCNLHGLWSTDL